MKYPIEVKVNIENTYDKLIVIQVVLLFGFIIFRKEVITIKYR